ncbi:MAG: hypothetical protein ACK4N5_08215 [Myxococcales bacterium]
MRLLLRSLLPASFLALPACFPPGDCEPDPTVTVTLEPRSEDVRSLPILASGKTRLLGIDVPDSHGETRIDVKLVNAPGVDITGLRYEQSVDGQVKEIELVKQSHNDQDVKVGGKAMADGQLKFQWRARNLTDLNLPVAKPHVAKAVLDWKFVGQCGVQTGVATVEVPGLVKAAVSATNFKLVDSSIEVFKPDAVKGSKAKLSLQSAVGDAVTNFKDARLLITYYGTGLAPTIGLGLVEMDKLAFQVEQKNRTEVAPNETLQLYTSANARQDGALWEHAGAAAGAVSEGKALVTLTIGSSKKSEQTTVQVDSISALVDLK